MDNSYIGKLIDNRYEIISLIGVGGMSNVYKAIDTASGNTVAIKFLKQEFFGNEELVRRFKNESKAISLLDNPNIIKVIDVNISADEKYIVVEYIDGITLKDYIDNRKVLTWQETVRFTSTILSAIGHAHDNGIIHRDLKPQNIMLLRDGTLKIMDFGIARLSTANQKTVTDKAIGSVHYISPEQVKGKNSDGRSDIYSIGIMMYEMLTGTLPFVSDTAVSVAIKQVSDTARRPSEIVQSIPKGLEQIVLKAIEKNADDRYPSAQRMLKDLMRFKANPAIEFNYEDDGKTQTVMVEKVAKKTTKKKNGANVKKGVKITLPMLAGVAAAFAVSALVAIFLIFKLSDNPLLTSQRDVELPNFIGMTEEEIKNSDYKFNFDIEYAYSSEYAEGVVFSQNPKPPKTIKEKGTVRLKISQGAQSSQLPDLSGYSRSEASKVLSEMGVNVEIQTVRDNNIKIGYVIRTEPEKGTILTSDSTVTLYVSSGDGSTGLNMVTVPNVVGVSSMEEASKILASNNLSLGSYTYRRDGSPSGTVIEQSPGNGEKVLAGSGISLVISSGPPTCPDCGATDHTVHPTCEICGSKSHLKGDHVCELCGQKGHGKDTCPDKCPIHGSAHLASECPDNNPTPSPSPDPSPSPSPDPSPSPSPDPVPSPSPDPSLTADTVAAYVARMNLSADSLTSDKFLNMSLFDTLAAAFDKGREDMFKKVQPVL